MHCTLSKPCQHILTPLLKCRAFQRPVKYLWALVLVILTGLAILPTLAAADALSELQAGQRAFNAGDLDRSFTLWSTLATLGHADAQVFVGLSYQNGWGTTRSAKLAEVWYRKAARNNNASGQYLLGLQYIQGSAVDRSKGLMWLQRAAANGDIAAQQFIKKGEKRGWFSRITPTKTQPIPSKPPPKPGDSTAKRTDLQSSAFAG